MTAVEARPLSVAHDGGRPFDSAPFRRGFVVAFCLLLAGYALFGKGFAYLGFPPIYVGEVAIFAGSFVALSAGRLDRAISNAPGLALLPLMAWTLVCTIPYVPEYGFNALRDSVITMYAIFAFIMATLIARDPTTLEALIRLYRLAIPVFVIGLTVEVLFKFIVGDEYSYDVLDFFRKPGEVLIQLAGIYVFVLLGFGRLPMWLAIVSIIPVTFSAALTRGGSLAFLAALAVAVIFMRKTAWVRKLITRVVVVSVALVTILVVFDVNLPTPHGLRMVSASNLVGNFFSIVDDDVLATTDLKATKEWRENWWENIIAYTVHGPYFWSGKGFGVNLADDDGFQVINEGAPLRNPHNASMTMLARAGIPGLVLWLVALATWLVAMARGAWRAQRAGDDGWCRFFVTIVSFWIAFLVDGSFSTTLESPMNGIWFWTLHGIGIGSLVVHHEIRLAR